MARPARLRRRPVRSLGRSAIDTAVFLVALAMVVAILKFSGVLTIDDGPVKVIDGDSLRRDNIEIRLAGIDAPEYRQTCKDESGNDWPCGREAMRALKQMIGGGDVACEIRDTDRYDGWSRSCMAGQIDLNVEMVQQRLRREFRRLLQGGSRSARRQERIVARKFRASECVARAQSYGARRFPSGTGTSCDD